MSILFDGLILFYVWMSEDSYTVLYYYHYYFRAGNEYLSIHMTNYLK